MTEESKENSQEVLEQLASAVKPVPGATAGSADFQNNSAIVVTDLRKYYRVGQTRVAALNGVSFEIPRGQFCSIVGTSGSGKSTLLNMLAGLEPPTGGSIFIGKYDISKMKETELVRFRREHVGFIFQSFNLIPTLNAIENVSLALIFRGEAKSQRERKAKLLLQIMGLSKHMYHRPTEMSGGQQQRVGIARALVVRPDIIFADEPTGNLDSKTSVEIMQLMQKISKENQQTLIMVTHDNNLAHYADRIIRISDGSILSIEEGNNRYEMVQAQQAQQAQQAEQTASPAQ